MSQLTDVFELLFERFGPQHWWPGETSWEVMVGAILTQNTNWNNVEKALVALRDADALSPKALQRISEPDLAEVIKPAGYYRLKARRLKNLVSFVMSTYHGSLDDMFAADADTLREQLLQINGIGPETADSILLYAGKQPVFVVDTYTVRLLVRHGWIGADADYHQVQSHFLASLPNDVALFNEFHALIVRLGKEYCKKQPLCDGCPLETLLPDHGPCP